MDANEQKARELLLASQRELGVTFFSPVSAQEQAAIRAIMAALAQQAPQPVVDATIGQQAVDDAMKGVLASLVAAISLLERGGKKAAPSNRMFEQMLADYRKAVEQARAALAAHGKPNG